MGGPRVPLFTIPNAMLYDYPYCIVFFEGQSNSDDWDPALTLREDTLAQWHAKGWRLLLIAPDRRGNGYRVVFEKRAGGNATNFTGWHSW